MLDENSEVVVGPDSLLVIHRGELMTVAQIFGEDWCTAPAAQFHGAALSPAMAVTAGMPEVARQYTPASPGQKPPSNAAWILFAAGLGALIGWLLLKVIS